MHVILRNGHGRVQFETDVPEDKATSIYYTGEPIVVLEPEDIDGISS